MGFSSAVNTCFEGSWKCIGNPENRFYKCFQKAEFRDKLLKCADPVLDTIGESAKALNASSDTLRGISIARDVVKGGRDGHAIFNIFNGVIGGAISSYKTCKELLVGLYTGNDVPLKAGDRAKIAAASSYVKGIQMRNKLAPSTVAKTPLEKFLALGANFGKGTAAWAYAFAFGLQRPIQTLNKYFKDKDGKPLVRMSDSAVNFGKAFATTMMINHVASILGSSCEIAYQYVAFNRGLEEGHDPGKLFEALDKKVLENIVGLLEKLLELLMDIVHITGEAAPAWFRLPVTLGIGIFGVTKEVLKVE